MKKRCSILLSILLVLSLTGWAGAGSYTATISNNDSIQGPAGTGTATPGKLTLATKETTVVASDELGRINFNAPLEADGTDAILPGASIWAVAEDTFAADNNKTSLVFATGASEAAAEKMRIDSAGNVGIGNSALESWDSWISALQLGGTTSIAASTSPAAGAQVYFQQNAYYDSNNTRWEYYATGSDEASQYYQANGQHIFSTAPAGTADNPITWTTAQTITSAGLTQFGTAGGAGQVNITPASAIDGLYIGQAQNKYGINIDCDAADYNGIYVEAKYPAYFLQNISGGRALFVSRNMNEAGSNPLASFTNSHANNTQPTLFIDHNGTGGATGYGLHVDSENAVGPAVQVDSASSVAMAVTGGVITQGGEQVATVPSVNTKMPSQAVELTAASTGSTGIVVQDSNDIDFGTGDFTLVWRGSLPDWTPSASTRLIRKSASGADGYTLYVKTDNKIQVYMSADYSSTVAASFVDNTVHEIVAVATREAVGVAGSFVFYVDGVQLGASVAIPAGSPIDVSVTSPIYIAGSNNLRHASRTEAAYTFNYALSADEVADLYKNGVSYADKFGSQTAVYTSDFSAGLDSWNAGIQGTAAGNIDGIDGEDNTLRFTVNAVSAGHYTQRTMFDATKNYKFSLRYYVPSTNSNADGIQVSRGSDIYHGTTLDAWTTLTGDIQSKSTAFYIGPEDGGNQSFEDAGGDDVVYFKDITITEIGATLALVPENIQTDKWYDATTNNLDASYPAAGASLVRPAADVFPGFVYHSMTTGITAVNPGVQGDGDLTTSYNHVTTVGTADDAVTLPAAVVGLEVNVRNDGANQLEVWPASGDDCGSGVDTACTIAAGAAATYVAIDATTWKIW